MTKTLFLNEKIVAGNDPLTDREFLQEKRMSVKVQAHSFYSTVIMDWMGILVIIKKIK